MLNYIFFILKIHENFQTLELECEKKIKTSYVNKTLQSKQIKWIRRLSSQKSKTNVKHSEQEYGVIYSLIILSKQLLAIFVVTFVSKYLPYHCLKSMCDPVRSKWMLSWCRGAMW